MNVLALAVCLACAVCGSMWAMAQGETPPTIPQRIEMLERELATLKNAAATPAASPEQQATMTERLEQLERDLAVLKDAVTEPEGSIQTTVNDVKKLKKIKVSGYVQARYEQDESANEGTTGTDKQGFDVRRARLKVAGQLGDKSMVTLQLDAGGTSVSTKDAYLEYFFKDDPAFGSTVTAGQFKWPFGYQVVQSSSVRETPERARVIRELFPGERDRGVKFSTKTDGRFFGEVGIFNGTGTNAKDINKDKDIVGRVRMQVTPNLDAGVSGYVGNNFNPQTMKGTDVLFPTSETNKTRFGADAQFFFGSTSLKAEYVTGKDVLSIVDDKATGVGHYQPVTKSGYYAQLAHSFTSTDMGVVMYDVYDNGDDRASAKGTLTSWNIGWVHWLDGATRLRGFYEINDEERNATDNNVVRIELITLF